METHIKVLGWLYIIFGIIGLFSAACIGVLMIGGGLISGDEIAIRATTIISIIVGLFLLLISAPGIIAGWGLLQYRSWARVLTIILGILNLPGVPIGTILGIYTLIVLLDDRSSQLFENNM